jgi:hypothetical protein
VDVDELNLLDRLARHVPGRIGDVDRYLFSRSGFTDRLRTFAETDPQLHLVTPADVYSPGEE